MKKTFIALTLCLFCAALFFSSCKKTAIPMPATTCTIVFNDIITRTADSIHWDYYNGTIPHMQAFIGGVAVITLWPSTFSSHTETLGRQYLYWIIDYPAVYTVSASVGGTLTMTNSSGVLSGTCSATGDVWSNGSSSTPATSKVRVAFSNVKQLGH